MLKTAIYLGICILGLVSCNAVRVDNGTRVTDKELSVILDAMDVIQLSDTDKNVYYLSSTPFNLKAKDEWKIKSYEGRVYDALAKRGLNFRPVDNISVIHSTVMSDVPGKEGWIQWISLHWVDDKKVIVDMGIWNGGLSGGGRRTIYVFYEGRWWPTEDLGHWYS